MAEKTLFIIKPDAVSRGISGRILSRFERRGFILRDMRMFTFTKDQAEKFYMVHRDRPFFGELVSFITSGPVIAVIIEGNSAISATRMMVGATKSYEAAPGSIRGDYGTGISDNVIHASDSPESYTHESGVAFGRP